MAGSPCCDRGEQNDDLDNLFQRSEHVARLAADLPHAQPRHEKPSGCDEDETDHGG